MTKSCGKKCSDRVTVVINQFIIFGDIFIVCETISIFSIKLREMHLQNIIFTITCEVIRLAKVNKSLMNESRELRVAVLVFVLEVRTLTLRTMISFTIESMKLGGIIACPKVVWYFVGCFFPQVSLS